MDNYADWDFDLKTKPLRDEIERLIEKLEIEEEAYDMLATQHDVLQARVEALGSLIKSSDADSERTRNETITVVAKNLHLQARVEELEGALLKYGDHDYDCEIGQSMPNSPSPCNCGFLAATEQELWCPSCKVSHSPDCEVHHHLMADGRCTCKAATEPPAGKYHGKASSERGLQGGEQEALLQELDRLRKDYKQLWETLYG